MNWIETLGPSRPPLLASRRLSMTVTPAELRAIFENLRADEVSTGYKTNIDLQTLCKCLYAAAKMEGDELRECQESDEFHELYSELFSFVEVYLTEFPCLKRSPGETEVILYCLGILVDLSKLVLRTIDESTPPRRIRDAVFVVRTLCRALDRELPFHQQHEHMALPTGLLEGPRRYVSYRHIDMASDACGSPMKRRRGAVSVDRSSCRCAECGTVEPQLWIKCLVEHFGRCCTDYGADTRGFDVLKRLLPLLHQLPIELTEVMLHIFAKTTETLREDLRSNLIIPFTEFLRELVERCGRELDRTSIEVFVVILKHLRSTLKFLLPPDIAQNLLADLQNQIQEMLLETMAADSESGITRGPDQSVFDETLRKYSSATFSLDAAIRHGIAWIRYALQGSTGDAEKHLQKSTIHLKTGTSALRCNI